MSNLAGRPRNKHSWDKTTLCVRYFRAIRSLPSKKTIKDIKNWIAKMKWLEKKKWATEKRTEAIDTALTHLLEHNMVVDALKANNWAERYISNYHQDMFKEDLVSLVEISKQVLKDEGVQGFTVLNKEKALTNPTIIPMVDFKNKHSGKTLCVYKDFAEGKTSIMDYYNG